MQRHQDAESPRGCQSAPRALIALTPPSPRQRRLGDARIEHGDRRRVQVESEQFAALVPTRDLAEGINAWVERRPPVYTGS